MQTRSRSHALCICVPLSRRRPFEPMPRPGTGHVMPRTTENRRTYPVPPPPSHCPRRVYGTFGVWGISSIVFGRAVLYFSYLCTRFLGFLFRFRSPDSAQPSAPYRGLWCTRTVNDFFCQLLPELFTRCRWRLTRRRVNIIIFIAPAIIISKLRRL